MPNCAIKLFADDINIFYITVHCFRMFRWFVNYEWFHANMLSVSLTKTCYSLFELKSINNVDICVKKRQLQIAACIFLQISWCYHRWTAKLAGTHLPCKLIKFTGLFLQNQRSDVMGDVENVVFFIYWFSLTVWCWDLAILVYFFH